MEKEILSINELKEIGYEARLLRQITRSEDFYLCGFWSPGKGKAYFNKTKLEKYLEKRTKWQ